MSSNTCKTCYLHFRVILFIYCRLISAKATQLEGEFCMCECILFWVAEIKDLTQFEIII